MMIEKQAREQKEIEMAARDELRHREDSAGLKVEISSLDDSFIDEPAVKEEKVVNLAKVDQNDNKSGT